LEVNLDDEIENWRRVVRTGKVVHRCGSLEGQYRKTGLEVLLDGEAPPPASAPLDILRGWRVELAWRQLPEFRVRLLVSYHVIRNLHIIDAARKAKLTGQQARFHFERAKSDMARKLLTDKHR
jgi:hypothetical protein